MISYVTVGANDFEAACKFYDAVLGVFGHVRADTYAEMGWASWRPKSTPRPLLWVARPFDGKPAGVGNGSMIGLHADTPAQVDAFHQAALENGGVSEGAPGPRPQYGEGMYIAYVRDPEGNKFSAYCGPV
jgi:catechol 2,3-dioxygenase-like lactoylglutathione lyase family enzyme